ncbi:hypothetical protein JOE09_003206 [Pantoea coffeiphila]|nr:hypothetical protein [Pantoea coffeiphila]
MAGFSHAACSPERLRWLAVPPVGRSSRRFAVPSLRLSASRTNTDAHLRYDVYSLGRLRWLAVPPAGRVLAPRCGSFTSLVSLPDRHRRASLPGCDFRPRPCSRILASSLRSALWIALSWAQSACSLTFVLPENLKTKSDEIVWRRQPLMLRKGIRSAEVEADGQEMPAGRWHQAGSV